MPSPTPSATEAARGEDAPNALARGFGLLGDEWTLLLLRLTLLGHRRWSQLRSALPISDAVLTARLDAMVDQELLERHEYSQAPPRHEYLPTPRATSAWPILVAIWGWELTHSPRDAFATPAMHHTRCGQPCTPVLTCGACPTPGPVTGEHLRAAWGPAGSWAGTVPTTGTRRRRTGSSASVYPETMAIFGNRWSAAVVGGAFMGLTRFSDFTRLLQVPTAPLSERLSDLVARGFLARVDGERSAYRLTAKGAGFLPVVVTTIEWAERWFADPRGRTVELTHSPVGSEEHTFTPRLACSACGEPLRGDEVRPGPAYV